jgi:hypothetical protein
VELALPTLAMTDFFLVILAIDDPGDDPWADDNSNDDPCVPPVMTNLATISLVDDDLWGVDTYHSTTFALSE